MTNYNERFISILKERIKLNKEQVEYLAENGAYIEYEENGEEERLLNRYCETCKEINMLVSSIGEYEEYEEGEL